MDVVEVTRGLSAAAVEAGYRKGIFPMSDGETDIITWHRPRFRAVIPLNCFHVPRSLGRRMRKGGFEVTFDQDFGGVMRGCADRESTWISEAFHRVYGELHEQGKAHSAEVWVEGKLAGGVYGVQIGGAFFAESMFHRVTDMSKVALAALAGRLWERGFALLEVQYLTHHLARFGAVEISHKEYLRRLGAALSVQARF